MNSNEEEEISENSKENKKGRILVYIRIRPFNSSEIKLCSASPFKSIDTKNNLVKCKKKVCYINNL